MKEEDNMTKEVIWGVLVLAIILTTYFSHVEDRRHKEAMDKLEARKLELKAETPAESRETLRRVYASNDRVERGNR